VGTPGLPAWKGVRRMRIKKVATVQIVQMIYKGA
jgi:hypothetical protein